MSDYPAIQVEFTDAFCPRHGEPFRGEFPEGVGKAIPEVVTAFSEVEEVDTYSQGSAQRFQAAVAEFGPMCCAVPGEKLLAIYRRSGIGKLGICKRCNQGRRGTQYRVKDGEGLLLVEHMCFECVVERGSAPPTI